MKNDNLGAHFQVYKDAMPHQRGEINGISRRGTVKDSITREFDDV